MSGTSWTSLVIDELCALKRAGVTSFDEAWGQVMEGLPAPARRGRVRGDFDQVAWLQRCARDAWEDRQPNLRAFPTMLDRVS
jgi:hypothetical protein